MTWQQFVLRVERLMRDQGIAPTRVEVQSIIVSLPKEDALQVSVSEKQALIVEEKAEP